MRISRKRPKARKPQFKYRTNEYIRSPEVRLIDETGENVGVVSTSKALSMARESGLDLVEVSPLAQPPVAKIVDYSKLKYEEDKLRRKEKAKHKNVEIKVIRLSLRIGKHDTDTRINQAKKFLSGEDKVKIELNLRGRERQHRDLAKSIIEKFVEQVNEGVEVKIEQNIKVQGSQLSTLISKK